MSTPLTGWHGKLCPNTKGSPWDGPQAACTNNDTFTPNTTIAYMRDAISQTIELYNIDPARVVLLGHSRGAIATQAIGGADPDVAKLWAGVAAASHYDGAEQWTYSSHNGGTAGAIARARNLNDVPKFLTGECDLQTNKALSWLKEVARQRSCAGISKGIVVVIGVVVVVCCC
jgi:pimeloyl-ACP methyl ester carboxylesterase